jgi:hypothetical protein
MDALPSSIAISRIGTRTPCGPSTRIFVELGYAELKSDIPLSLRRSQPEQVPRVCSQSRFRDTPGGLKRDYIKKEAEA